MSKESDPRGVNLSRRGLWRQLIGRAVVWRDEMRGQRHFSLADLDRMPDAALAEVVPVFRRDGGFRLEQGRLFADADDPEKRECVYECTEEEAYVLGRFDSGTPLGDIGREVEQQYELPDGQGFARARALFLDLARRVICHPAGPNEA